ncbi:hypothetical protein F7725_003524 [Dissostichus mawsoni]|uniref:Uncharacterized protein n=1 Tax=Dissostichus mawsoni TaxID=36200 RepID=A0A7J5YAF3_DISMA|nr:hypothetical protein F7725_003524 [Dissostichus mawsoni]
MKKYSYPVRSASTRTRRTDREGSGITSPSGGDRVLHKPFALTRRNTNPLRSSASSTSSQRSYDQSFRSTEYSSPRSSPSETTNPRSPKTGMRRMELSGGRNPDTASSRRTEMSIEVSSKQIDNSPSAGIARFGLKRPEVSLSNRSTLLDSSSNSTSTNRRAEISMTRQHEPPPLRRGRTPRCPQPQSRGSPSPLREEWSSSPQSPAQWRKPPGSQRCPSSDSQTVWCPAVQWRTTTTTNHPPPAPSAPLPSLAEPRVERVERVESPVPEPPTARPTERPEVIPSYSSSAMSEVVMPDAMVSPAVGVPYVENPGGPWGTSAT